MFSFQIEDFILYKTISSITKILFKQNTQYMNKNLEDNGI